MREIKFRAWDKKGEQMINYISSLNFKNQNFISIVSEYDLDVHNGENLGHYERHVSEVEVMQFTGLQDKNGKEIYEGDIVNGIFIKNVKDKEDILIGTIRYYSPSFYICPLNDNKFVMPYNDNILVDKNTNYEVIGNLYEHPNLIK